MYTCKNYKLEKDIQQVTDTTKIYEILKISR